MKSLAIIALLGLSACTHNFSTPYTYTLYRTVSTNVMSEGKLPVATFGTKVGRNNVSNNDYNGGNCDTAQALFNARPHTTVRFFCELVNY